MGARTKTTLTGSMIIAAAVLSPQAPPRQPGPVLPDTLFDYATAGLPAHFTAAGVQALDNTPADNPITDAGATLGRVLFYDTQLSANNTVACASCHVQAAGFSDPRTLSVGFEGGQTRRNSMGLTNARYYRNGRFFWDERAETLEHQVLMPIQDSVEMGMSLQGLEEKLQNVNYYPGLFRDAFGASTVTSERISKALAQFVRSLVSHQSPYDEGRGQANSPFDDFPNFTEQENLGKQVFFSGSGRSSCAGCHMQGGRGGRGQRGRNTAIFFVQGTANNGLDADRGGDDGRGEITGRGRDDGEFKTPSLRNVELTAPYMHDGRFAILEDVMTHYSSGIQNHPNLDNRLRGRGRGRGRGGQARRGAPQGQSGGLNLSDGQQQALVAFLKTLTDETFIQDVRFSNPFR